MATVKAVLNKDREKKHGGYSLIVQVIHKRTRRVIYTPYTLKTDEFNPLTQKVIYNNNARFTRRQANEINDFVTGKISEINKIIDNVSTTKMDYTVQDIIDRYHHNKNERYLTTFINQMIEQKERLNKMGTAKVLHSTLNSIERFLGKQTVKFSDVDHNFVKCYESYLYSTGIQENTVCFYLRNLRAIYNYAYDNGVEMNDTQPFRKVTIRNAKTAKRALKLETLKKIVNIKLDNCKQLDNARDLFMFSFYGRGMSFIDIIHLRNSDITHGVIRYNRHKTNQAMQVTITAPLQKLIDKYQGDNTYVLPFINNSDKPTLYQKYQAAYGYFYRNLKALEDILGLDMPLTTHVARHSWATIAKEHGVHLATISEALGHTSEKTTAIYLKEFDTSVIDKVNDMIIQLFSTEESTN